MDTSLIKVLGSMKMDEENKVLIAIKLQKREHILAFLKWLKAEIPENEVSSRQDEITNKALKISEGF